MNNTKVNQVRPKKSYLAILFVFIGLAAFSSAMKELNQLRAFTAEATSLIAALSSVIAPTSSEPSPSVVVTCNDSHNPPEQNVSHFEKFDWNGTAAQAAIERIKHSVDDDRLAMKARPTKIEMLAVKKPRTNHVRPVNLKLLPQLDGINICARNQGENQTNDCFPVNFVGLNGRKRVKARIGFGVRELLLKTSNGSINLRIAS